jgi:hypothetical protein
MLREKRTRPANVNGLSRPTESGSACSRLRTTNAKSLELSSPLALYKCGCGRQHGATVRASDPITFDDDLYVCLGERRQHAKDSRRRRTKVADG